LTQPSVPADSPHDFETATGAFASGVTLVTIADGREDIGLTVSAFCPLSARPPLVSISLIGESYPAELLSRIDRFAVTVLAGGPREGGRARPGAAGGPLRRDRSPWREAAARRRPASPRRDLGRADPR
jgi:hypothetical protein